VKIFKKMETKCVLSTLFPITIITATIVGLHIYFLPKSNFDWSPIYDCREDLNLVVTPPDSTNNKWRTDKFDPSNENQLWRHDDKGQLINKATGKVLKGDHSGPDLLDVDSDPESIYAWSFDNLTRSNQETTVKNSQKLKIKTPSYTGCLNIANRFQLDGSSLMMYPCDKIAPINGCFKHNKPFIKKVQKVQELVPKVPKSNFTWLPIYDCREKLNLALTPPDSTSNNWRTYKFDPSNENQLWRHDDKGQLINKASGKVFKWDSSGPGLLSADPDLTYAWSFNNITRSNQETTVANSQKLELNSPRYKGCLNIGNRNKKDGSFLIMYSCGQIHPINGCFKFYQPIIEKGGKV